MSFVRIKTIRGYGGLMLPYAYLVKSVWNSEKKSSRQKVIAYLGRVDIGTFRHEDVRFVECAQCNSKENLTIDRDILPDLKS